MPLPLAKFAVETPHPYQKLGATYGSASPYCLRQSARDRLLQAQKLLEQHHPGWKLYLFDAYRPVAVQQFMVDRAFCDLVAAKGWQIASLSETERRQIAEDVAQFWAVPSLDPQTPPPHSTGAAIDLTLADATGTPLNLGSQIDEISPRSHPDYYAKATTPEARAYCERRQLLYEVMRAAGFHRHWGEWWHFSWGDQMWAWLERQAMPDSNAIARYGRVES